MADDLLAEQETVAPPRVLEACNIEAVAKYILERDVRRIVVMVHLSIGGGVEDNNG